ncbi:MAG: hypothetical protein GXO43_09955 [Crenarchaeota archaeon]|nr:hypothetical protein [Thermoproteota archaeon]
MKYLALLILISFAFSITLVFSAEAPSGQPIDFIVYYHNDEGYTILAQDYGQVPQSFNLRVYTSYPGLEDITIQASDGTVLKHISDTIIFMREYSITLPRDNIGIVITVKVEGKQNAYTLVKHFTVVKSPQPRPQSFEGWLSPKQWKRMVEELKWNIAITAAFFALAGIGTAIILRRKFLMLEPFTLLQLPFMMGAMYASYAVDPDTCVLYFIVFLLSDILSYKHIKGPETVVFHRYDFEKANVDEVELPVYKTEDGREAVALQDWKSAIKRTLLGRHIYIYYDGDMDVKWTLDDTTPLIMAEKLKVYKRKVSEEEEKSVVEQAKEKLAEKMGAEKEEYEHVMLVKPIDAHTLEFMRRADYFFEMKETCIEALEENEKLKETMDVRVRKARAEAVAQWINIIHGGELA